MPYGTSTTTTRTTRSGTHKVKKVYGSKPIVISSESDPEPQAPVAPRRVVTDSESEEYDHVLDPVLGIPLIYMRQGSDWRDVSVSDGHFEFIE